MVLLALLGVGLTTARSDYARAYWISLVPVYGVLCVVTAWLRARHSGGFNSAVVVRQILHWLGVAVALALDFLIRGTGEETAQTAGQNALLLLALGCYLAGIHLEWHFALVGVLLTLTLVVVAKAQQYMWLSFVVGGIVVVAIFGAWWLADRMRARKAEGEPKPLAAGS
jgi:hypothetical protein